MGADSFKRASESGERKGTHVIVGPRGAVPLIRKDAGLLLPADSRLDSEDPSRASSCTHGTRASSEGGGPLVLSAGRDATRRTPPLESGAPPGVVAAGASPHSSGLLHHPVDVAAELARRRHGRLLLPLRPEQSLVVLADRPGLPLQSLHQLRRTAASARHSRRGRRTHAPSSRLSSGCSARVPHTPPARVRPPSTDPALMHRGGIWPAMARKGRD